MVCPLLLIFKYKSMAFNCYRAGCTMQCVLTFSTSRFIPMTLRKVVHKIMYYKTINNKSTAVSKTVVSTAVSIYNYIFLLVMKLGWNYFIFVIPILICSVKTIRFCFLQTFNLTLEYVYIIYYSINFKKAFIFLADNVIY
jgi:hypothetical protein